MPDLTIAPEARNDLLEIGRYTQQNWGVKQRNLYLTEITDKLRLLVSGVVAGRPRDDVKPGLRSCPCRHHIVFFRRDDGGNVEVLRILHERMDVDAHL